MICSSRFPVLSLAAMRDDGNPNGWRSALQPGETCWRTERSRRVGVLVETSSYFEALRQACAKAKRSILILGWDFDRRERIGRKEDDPTIEEFLCALLEREAELHVHLLIWDYAFVYAAEREWFQEERLRYLTHERLHVKFDGMHPTGGSQHQKLVIIDDEVAFCGGIDLSRWRWDTSEHKPGDKRRMDPDGKPYPPFHDVMMLVEGPAAAALGELACDRWSRCGAAIDPPGQGEPDRAPWPECVEARWADCEVAIARTMPLWRDYPEIREIEKLYLDSIGRARHYIYIENQYFTSRLITQALTDRLSERDGPDIVLVLPRQTGGWLEQVTMDAIRSSRINQLIDADQQGKLRVFYPDHPGLDKNECISVHAKLMLSDDRFVHIGSANTSNRSMGLDSECDLALVDADGEGTRQLLHTLLAEHLDCREEDVVEARRSNRSLIGAIESLRRTNQRTLQLLDVEETARGPGLDGEEDVIDPEEPINAAFLVRRALPSGQARGGHFRMYLFLGFIVTLLVIALSWRWTPLGEWLTADRVTEWLSMFDATWVRFVTAALLVALLTLMMVPLTPLVVASAVLLGPWLGFASSMTGALVSAGIGFVIGILMGGKLLERYSESKVHDLSKRLSRRGVLAIAVLRMVPIAPYSVVNIVAGASHLKLNRFLIGTAIGMVPGIGALSWFSDSLWQAVKQPSAESLGVLLAVTAFIATGVLLLRRILKSS